MSPYKNVEFSEPKTTSLLKYVMSSKNGIVLVAQNEDTVIGFLAALVSDLPFADVRVAAELAWWVDPEFRGFKDGLKLLEAYEYWARNVVKCDYIQVANLMNDYAPALNKLYSKRGYEKKEETWLYPL